MSSISDIYSEVYDQYMCSLLQVREGKGGNPAEQSLAYTWFFREYLYPCGVAESGKEKEGEYVFPEKEKTVPKQKDTLDQIYRAWDAKKEIKWTSKNTPVLLMLAYNRYLKDGKILRFLRLMLTYMTERPLRYREGHVFYESESGEAKQMYLTFLAGLYSIAEKRPFKASDHREMQSVQSALLKLLRYLQESGKPDEKILEELRALTPGEMRKVTDGLLRTSLHGNIKDYFFNMGYSVSRQKAEDQEGEDGEEVKKEKKANRKQDKSLAFLERCLEEMDYQLLSHEEQRLRSDDGDEEYKTACRRLVAVMNRIAERSGYTQAVVPLMAGKDVLLCVIGKNYFCDLYKKIYRCLPRKGVFDPKRIKEKESGSIDLKQAKRKADRYVYAVMQMDKDDRDLLCFGPYMAFDEFDEAKTEYTTRIKERDPLLAAENQQLLNGIKNTKRIIPEVFWDYFALFDEWDEEQDLRDVTRDELRKAEEDGLMRMKEKKV